MTLLNRIPLTASTHSVTRYLRDLSILRGILDKYWCLLRSDEKTAPFVADSPSIVFKISTSIHDCLVHSDSSIRPIPAEAFGLSRCGHCKTCEWLKKWNDLRLPYEQRHHLKNAVNCDTRGVVYILTRICGSFYIGKTKRLLDHQYDIKVDRLNRPICRHVGLKHKYDPQVIVLGPRTHS